MSRRLFVKVCASSYGTLTCHIVCMYVGGAVTGLHSAEITVPIPRLLWRVVCMNFVIWVVLFNFNFNTFNFVPEPIFSLREHCVLERFFINGMSLVILCHPSRNMRLIWLVVEYNPDNKIHGTNIGPTWVLSATDGPHLGPMKLAINPRTMHSVSGVFWLGQFSTYRWRLLHFTGTAAIARFSHCYKKSWKYC